MVDLDSRLCDKWDMGSNPSLRNKHAVEPGIEKSVLGFAVSKSEAKLSRSWRVRLSGKVANGSNGRFNYCIKCGNRVSPRPNKVHLCSKSPSSKFVRATNTTLNEMLAEQAVRLAELQTGNR